MKRKKKEKSKWGEEDKEKKKVAINRGPSSKPPNQSEAFRKSYLTWLVLFSEK